MVSVSTNIFNNNTFVFSALKYFCNKYLLYPYVGLIRGFASHKSNPSSVLQGYVDSYSTLP